MTMPHLMNCSHSEDGWCLECVKELNSELAAAQAENTRLKEIDAEVCGVSLEVIEENAAMYERVREIEGELIEHKEAIRLVNHACGVAADELLALRKNIRAKDERIVELEAKLEEPPDVNYFRPKGD